MSKERSNATRTSVGALSLGRGVEKSVAGKHTKSGWGGIGDFQIGDAGAEHKSIGRR